MLDALTERVLKEGRVIKDAPVAFGVCVGLSFLICLAIVNWHYSERLELQKSTIDSQKDRIEAQSNKLVEYQRELGRGIQPSVLTAQSLPPSVVKRLADYSNAELRDNATQFVAELRRFDARFNVEDQRQQQLEWFEQTQIPNNDQETRHKKWNENIMKDIDRRNRHNAEFNTRFRSVVLAYREEICKRQEFISPCLQDSISRMLEVGMLAGAYPIISIADYLDSLARNLRN